MCSLLASKCLSTGVPPPTVTADAIVPLARLQGEAVVEGFVGPPDGVDLHGPRLLPNDYLGPYGGVHEDGLALPTCFTNISPVLPLDRLTIEERYREAR